MIILESDPFLVFACGHEPDLWQVVIFGDANDHEVKLLAILAGRGLHFKVLSRDVGTPTEFQLGFVKSTVYLVVLCDKRQPA